MDKAKTLVDIVNLAINKTEANQTALPGGILIPTAIGMDSEYLF